MLFEWGNALSAATYMKSKSLQSVLKRSNNKLIKATGLFTSEPQAFYFC